MACFHPLRAYQSADGSVFFSELARNDSYKTLQLPCGQCWGCRLERSYAWAIRCVHESKMWDVNCSVTLTYSNEFLPADGGLDYSHFQGFMKRVRDRFRDRRIRFYMCGEYGDCFGRPHYHAILFNHDFSDKRYFKMSKDGKHRLYTSALLDEVWGFGHCLIGDCSIQSAGYVARYCMKKLTVPDENPNERYMFFNVVTGEVFMRAKEFSHMSLKPGIGAEWLQKFWRDVYPHGKVVVGGMEVKPPKFYDKKFFALGGVDADQLEYERYMIAQRDSWNNTDVRLAVREAVVQAAVRSLTRPLD